MKEYKMAKGWAIFIYVAALPLFVLFSLPILLLLIPAMNKGETPPPAFFWIGIPIALTFMGLTVAAVIDTAIGKVSIDKKQIRAKNVFSTRWIALDDVKGFRIHEHYIFIEPKTEWKKRIKIQKYYGNLEELVAWLEKKYPDLDKIEEEQRYQAMLKDPTFGSSLNERMGALRRAEKTATMLNVIAVIISAWVILWPVPYLLVLLLAIITPILALMVLKGFNGLIRLDEQKNSAHPTVFWAFFVPSLGLAMRAAFDFDILEYDNIWLPLSLIVMLFVVIILVNNKEFDLRKGRNVLSVIGLALLSLCYAYGTVITTNCYFDHSNGIAYRAEIVGKSISTGKTTIYYLDLAPWGPRKQSEEVSVPKHLYDQLQQGDEVRIILFKGKFDIPWFILVR